MMYCKFSILEKRDSCNCNYRITSTEIEEGEMLDNKLKGKARNKYLCFPMRLSEQSLAH